MSDASFSSSDKQNRGSDIPGNKSEKQSHSLSCQIKTTSGEALQSAQMEKPQYWKKHSRTAYEGAQIWYKQALPPPENPDMFSVSYNHLPKLLFHDNSYTIKIP